jgi:hypothetical protein
LLSAIVPIGLIFRLLQVLDCCLSVEWLLLALHMPLLLFWSSAISCGHLDCWEMGFEVVFA